MQPAVLATIAANLVPIAGVLAMGWSPFEVFALYWTENLVIGLYTILKFWCADPGDAGVPPIARLGMSVFFAFHYGIFNFVHGAFIVVFFAGESVMSGNGFAMPTSLVDGPTWSLAALGLLASHGITFVTTFWRQERRRSSLQNLMGAPYGRVIAMHLTLLAGGFLLFLVGNSAPLLALLVALKTYVDLRTLRREQARGAT